MCVVTHATHYWRFHLPSCFSKFKTLLKSCIAAFFLLSIVLQVYCNCLLGVQNKACSCTLYPWSIDTHCKDYAAKHNVWYRCCVSIKHYFHLSKSYCETSRQLVAFETYEWASNTILEQLLYAQSFSPQLGMTAEMQRSLSEDLGKETSFILNNYSQIDLGLQYVSQTVHALQHRIQLANEHKRKPEGMLFFYLRSVGGGSGERGEEWVIPLLSACISWWHWRKFSSLQQRTAVQCETCGRRGQRCASSPPSSWAFDWLAA